MDVEVLNADARPLNKRFSKQQAIAIENNGVRIPVRWRSGADLHELAGKVLPSSIVVSWYLTIVKSGSYIRKDCDLSRRCRKHS